MLCRLVWHVLGDRTCVLVVLGGGIIMVRVVLLDVLLVPLWMVLIVVTVHWAAYPACLNPYAYHVLPNTRYTRTAA